MDGTISVSSEVGKGSRFKVVIPNVAIADNYVDKESERNFNPESIHFENAKVLIVDDIKSNRELLIDFFSYSPIKIYEAENGYEAVNLAKKYKPDLILMDIKMPIMDGIKATTILKNNKKTSGIPIIAVSASTGKNLSEAKEIEVFDEFLLKPISFPDLAEILKKYLKFSLSENTEITDKKKHKDAIISAGEINNLSVLVSRLENDYFPLYQEVVKNQVINQIEGFGQNLVSLGAEMSAQVIMDFGTEICELADRFEIGKLLDKLETFPLLIKNLKN